MKGSLTGAVLTGCLLMATVVGAAEYYKLNGVRRVEEDLYKTRDGLYIETQYCYHYTYGEDAMLKWNNDGSYDNKIIWDDDSTCGVKTIFKKP